MSIEVQASGYHHMASRIAGYFRRLGFDIRYERIANPKVSADQSRHLRLDLATPNALDLLERLGSKTAQDVQSECAIGTSLGAMVTSIFSQP